ncbi:polysaccharide deacetylase family protein [Acrocarpospora macrocephala]|uniref:polysaccharide deacetylase family protein n=1 Tax=Acrocarpospora macrocephala TaxID=150177 RepID=UPI001C3FDBE2|nr:polysaccharide deacetylase family protein [Acrocarpospora macrocephala]
MSIVVNYEEGGEMTHLQTSAPAETSCEWPDYPFPAGTRNLAVESMFEYGSRVGVWRVLRTIDDFEVPSTVFAAAVALEANPEVAAYLRASDVHEVCSHGYRWEEVFRLTEEEERAHLLAAVDSIERTTGRRPVGWYSRYGASERTRKLVVEEGGFEYDSDSYADDTPYTVTVDDRPWVVVPYSPDVNDLRFWQSNGPYLARDFFRYAADSLDVLYEESSSSCRLMSVGLHPRIIGRPGRISALRDFIDYAAQKDGVWFATRAEIAAAWKARGEA